MKKEEIAVQDIETRLEEFDIKTFWSIKPCFAYAPVNNCGIR